MRTLVALTVLVFSHPVFSSTLVLETVGERVSAVSDDAEIARIIAENYAERKANVVSTREKYQAALAEDLLWLRGGESAESHKELEIYEALMSFAEQTREQRATYFRLWERLRSQSVESVIGSVLAEELEEGREEIASEFQKAFEPVFPDYEFLKAKELAVSFSVEASYTYEDTVSKRVSINVSSEGIYLVDSGYGGRTEFRIKLPESGEVSFGGWDHKRNWKFSSELAYSDYYYAVRALNEAEADDEYMSYVNGTREDDQDTVTAVEAARAKYEEALDADLTWIQGEEGKPTQGWFIYQAMQRFLEGTEELRKDYFEHFTEYHVSLDDGAVKSMILAKLDFGINSIAAAARAEFASVPDFYIDLSLDSDWNPEGGASFSISGTIVEGSTRYRAVIHVSPSRVYYSELFGPKTGMPDWSVRMDFHENGDVAFDGYTGVVFLSSTAYIGYRAALMAERAFEKTEDSESANE